MGYILVNTENNIVSSGDGLNRYKLHESKIYIALVTPSFVTNDKCLGEMQDANALKKEMYALVKTETKLPSSFHKMNWKLIQNWSTKKEFDIASKLLKEVIGEQN